MTAIIVFAVSLVACLALCILNAVYLSKNKPQSLRFLEAGDPYIEQFSYFLLRHISHHVRRTAHTSRHHFGNFSRTLEERFVVSVERSKERFSNGLRGRKTISHERKPSPYFDGLRDRGVGEK